MLTKEEVARRIAEIEATRQKALDALAAEVREQVVVPLCKRHRLRYLSGNGHCMFVQRTKRGEAFTSQAEVVKQGCRFNLQPAFEILLTHVTDHHVIGDWVDSVGEK